jgi:DNA-binding SARP family transcriptional activator/ABC-type branched-subunit amino acid transport system substrate-binding protein
MAVCVLGPTGVDGARRLSHRDRAVLAVLVANRGVSVSPDQLADAVWGEQVPDSGRKIVQGVVVRLRKALGRAAIETTSGGYRLVLAGEEVDAWQFGDLVERARELTDLGERDRAVYALDEALGLWRGDPLQELEGWPPAAGEIARLAQLRCAAEERRLEALVSVGRHDEAAATAGALVAAEPLRERRWELFALALYRSGRQAEALRTIARARATLREELGIEPRAEMAELERAILNHDPGLAATIVSPSEVSERCPYKGLEAYGVDDAVSFFGRDTEIDTCRRRLASSGFLVVTGASGSGKSSLVRAGLVPRLRAEGRSVALCVPGVDPPAAVAAALATAGEDAVLVVDQLEELFTVCTDHRARERFAEAVNAHAGRQLVVLVLRADHVAATAALPELRRMVEDGLYLLGQMTEPQLREAIEGPAREAGLRLEPGLVDVLVRDVANEPGGLPLLSHALAETWARREGRVLTVAGYNDAGGVDGAVASTAERLYEELPNTQQTTARSLFLRLVEMVDDGDPVRHRLPRTIFDDEDQSARQVIDMLLRARLVTAGHDSLQIAHEALALAWPRLRAWLDEDREGQRILRHLTTAAQAWIARDRDPAELYRGSRLQTAEDWADAHPDELSGSESSFLDASRTARDQQERSQRQTTRRIRRQLTALSVLVVVALIAAGLAVGLAVALAGNGGRDDEDGGQSSGVVDFDELIRSGPMTPQKAELLDREDVDWGPACDTERGTIRLPTALAPPCVEPLTGDNGGATSPGVTGDEIKIVYYQTGPEIDPARTALIEDTGADVDGRSSARTVRDYVELYNHIFETYGRRVVVQTYAATGPGDDLGAARVDAIAIARQEPFAVIGGPAQASSVFASELAARGVICGPTCAASVPEAVVEANAPYVWPAAHTPEQMATLTAELLGNLAGPGLAEMAGDPRLRSQHRVYAIVHTDSQGGDDLAEYWELKRQLDDHGINLATDISIDLNLSRTRDMAPAVIARLKDAGVTTVIYVGDHLTAGPLTQEATAQNYYPEWLVGPSTPMDTSVARQTSPEQWKHGFGLTVNATPGEQSTRDSWRLYEWAYGDLPPNNTAGLLELPLRTLFTGVHLAGPHLTPDTFRDGLFRYPVTPVTGGGPTAPQLSWGGQTAWGIDHGGTDDVAIAWWDPEATGQDELGNPGRGMYRYANGGQRYTFGNLPTSIEEAGLFDEATSVINYDEIPEADRVPDYAPPDR